MVSLKKNILANFTGQSLSSILGFILVPVYINYLGVEAYGLMGILLSYQAITTVLDLGLSTAVNRQVARCKSNEMLSLELRTIVNTMQVIYVATGIVISVIFIALSSTIAGSWLTSTNIPKNTIEVAIIIFGITIGTRWPVGLYTGILAGMEKQVRINIISGVIVIFKSLGSIILLALLAQSLTWLLILHFFCALLELSVTRSAALRSLPKSSSKPKVFSFEVIREIWHYAAGVGIMSVSAIVLKQFDKILMSKLLPLENLGYYLVASQAASALSMVTSPITTAVFPRMSTLFFDNNRDELIKAYHKTTNLVAFIVAPISMFLIFFSRELLLFWTQSEKVSDNAYLPLMILAFAFMLNSVLQMVYMLQLATGTHWISLRSNAVAVIILPPLIYYLIGEMGILGAALSWLVLNFIYFIAIPNITHRINLLGKQRRWYLKYTLPYFVLALFVFGVLFCLSRWMGLIGFWYLSALIGFSVYLAILYVINDQIRIIVSGIIKVR